MNKTFTKDDGLPEGDLEDNDSSNPQSEESIEMVNHSDISDPSNNSDEIGDIKVPSNSNEAGGAPANSKEDVEIHANSKEDVEIHANSNEGVDSKKDAEAIPGDPMHSIKQLLERGSSKNSRDHINNHNASSEPEKAVIPALNQPKEVDEPLTTTAAEPIQPNSSTISMASEAQSLKSVETDAQSNSSESFESNNDGVRKDRRKTYHVRHNTVTITSPENIIAKEVASVLNELADSPPDSLMNILQQRLTEYAIEKENEWKGESERSFVKAQAMHEMRQAFEKRDNNSNTTSKPPSRPPSPGIDYERLIRERDQSHEHASATMRSLREIIRQQELLMDKEQLHSEHIHHIQKEMESTNATIQQLHHRYNALMADAEEELLQADVAVNRIRRELDDSMVTLRFKVRQQEMTIRSHETTVENLQAEKKELLTICEDLVAHTEARHPPRPLQSETFDLPLPSPVPSENQEAVRPPEMEDLGGF